MLSHLFRLFYCSVLLATRRATKIHFFLLIFITLTTDKTRADFSFHAPQLLIDDCAAGRSVLSGLCIILNLTLERRHLLDVHSRCFADLDWQTVEKCVCVINRGSNTCSALLSVTIKIFSFESDKKSLSGDESFVNCQLMPNACFDLSWRDSPRAWTYNFANEIN